MNRELRCSKVRKLLHDFETGRLDESLAYEVSEHLGVCPGCREAHESVSRCVDALDTWTVPPPSAEYDRKFMQRLAASSVPDSPSWAERLRGVLSGLWPAGQAWKPVAALAALLIVVVVGFEVRRGGMEPSPSPPEGVERDFRIDGGSPAARSIELIVIDLDAATRDLRSLVESMGGRIVRRRPVGEALEVRFGAPENVQGKILEGIGRLGEMGAVTEGYRDGEGNIVILLRTRLPATRSD